MGETDSGGFEKIFESAKESLFARDTQQVQCENCGTEFGTFDAYTWRLLTLRDISKERITELAKSCKEII